MDQRPAVRVCKTSGQSGIEWVVWLDDDIAGRFFLLGEALDFAAILECSPRARAAVCVGEAP